MTVVLRWLLENALVTVLLAVVVWSACRPLRNRPAMQHALWFVVLLKFVMPPIVAWPWSIPDAIAGWSRPSAVTTADEPPEVGQQGAPGTGPLVRPIDAPADEPKATDPAPDRFMLIEANSATDAGFPSRSLTAALFCAWGVGCLVALLMHVRRIGRHRALISRGVPAPRHLTGAIAELSGVLGVRPLRAVVVRRIGSPFLWCLGLLRLVWPESLVSEADVRRARGILAHELAHARRGDHWVAWLELVAGVIWWWNPVFWFVRRRLRESADMACDAVALSVLPDQQRSDPPTLLVKPCR